MPTVPKATSVVFTPSMIQLFSGPELPRKVTPVASPLVPAATFRTLVNARPVGTRVWKSSSITAPVVVDPWSMTGAAAVTTTSSALSASGTS